MTFRRLGVLLKTYARAERVRAFVGSIEPPKGSKFLLGRAIFPKSGVHFIGLRSKSRISWPHGSRGFKAFPSFHTAFTRWLIRQAQPKVLTLFIKSAR